MGSKNGININNIPFEQRCLPPRPRKLERLTPADRCVCAICGFFLGSVVWTYGYLGVISSVSRKAAASPQVNSQPVDPMSRIPSYWWGSIAAGGFAIFGATAGPERMMDVFEKTMHGISQARRSSV